MPKFTLIKHAESAYDSEITSTFHCELLDSARCHIDDFLQASGFQLPSEDDSDDVVLPKPMFDLYSAEDDLWQDAFANKFRNDGVDGSAGADIIDFPISDS